MTGCAGLCIPASAQAGCPYLKVRGMQMDGERVLPQNDGARDEDCRQHIHVMYAAEQATIMVLYYHTII
jgi:hypothetical protein